MSADWVAERSERPDLRCTRYGTGSVFSSDNYRLSLPVGCMSCKRSRLSRSYLHVAELRQQVTDFISWTKEGPCMKLNDINKVSAETALTKAGDVQWDFD